MRKDLMSNRVAIVLALAEERARPDPSEAVITACEVALRQMPDLKEHVSMYIELSQPKDD